MQPARALIGMDSGVAADHALQNIKVMDLSERVLQVAQVFRPLLVPLRQEVFYGVAKALDADAQLVPGKAAAIAQGPAVEFAGFHPSFERDVLEDWAFQRDVSRALGEVSVQCRPALAIETRQRFLRG